MRMRGRVGIAVMMAGGLSVLAACGGGGEVVSLEGLASSEVVASLKEQPSPYRIIYHPAVSLARDTSAAPRR